MENKFGKSILFLTLFFIILSAVIALLAIFLAIYLSKRTDKVINKIKATYPIQQNYEVLKRWSFK